MGSPPTLPPPKNLERAPAEGSVYLKNEILLQDVQKALKRSKKIWKL